MKEGLNNYDVDPDTQFAGVKATWDSIQSDFKCCGVEYYSDWKMAEMFQGQRNDSVPDACCKEEMENCGKGVFKLTLDQVKEKVYVEVRMESKWVLISILEW